MTICLPREITIAAVKTLALNLNPSLFNQNILLLKAKCRPIKQINLILKIQQRKNSKKEIKVNI